jgi:hypothetical protein
MRIWRHIHGGAALRVMCKAFNQEDLAVDVLADLDDALAERDALKRELATLREFILCDCRVKGKSTVSHTANCPARAALQASEGDKP